MYYLVRYKNGKLTEVVGTCDDCTLEDVKNVITKHLKYNQNLIETVRKVKSPKPIDDKFVNDAFEVRAKYEIPSMPKLKGEDFYLLQPRLLPVSVDNTDIVENVKFEMDVKWAFVKNVFNLLISAIYVYATNDAGGTGILRNDMRESVESVLSEYAEDIFGEYLQEIRKKDPFMEVFIYLEEVVDCDSDVRRNIDMIKNTLQFVNLMRLLDINKTIEFRGDGCVNESFVQSGYFIENGVPKKISGIENGRIFVGNEMVYAAGDKDFADVQPIVRVVPQPEINEGEAEILKGTIEKYVSDILGVVSTEYFIERYLNYYYLKYDMKILVEPVERILDKMVHGNARLKREEQCNFFDLY